MKNFVEIYCGSGEMSRSFRSHGFNTFSIDKRKRKGICWPDLRKDIMDVTAADIPFSEVHAAWFGQPCTAFSHAAGDYYFKNGLFNDRALPYLELLHATMTLIDLMHPKVWYIENPRGHIRKYKPFVDWVYGNGYSMHTITLGSYGFPTPKPTLIFSNVNVFPVARMIPHGRGSRKRYGSYDTIKDNFNSLTTVSRQKYPFEFCNEVARFTDIIT